ncbi:agmatine deiminase family protein [Citricoccus sp. CH26A]|uniref:agmatine deiminase family protein n=1 Tax=Citricoccus TaxID=169133 RepID=UPI0003107B8E|nr:agmatine deiminase family protein [Citricoccus sp. CH26A]
MDEQPRASSGREASSGTPAPSTGLPRSSSPGARSPAAEPPGSGTLLTGTTEDTWHLPADTEPQERLWLAFPRDYSRMGASSWEVSGARRAWARVAHAVMDYEPVTLLVDPADRQIVHTYVDPLIPVVPLSMDNPFLRLSGPTFTVGGVDGRTGQRRIGMIDWVFNGFGRRPGVEFRLDDVAGGTLAELTGARRQLSLLVNEGGAFITDGEGTLIASESVLLDPARNPGWSRAHVEAEFARYTDIRKVIWLPRGLARDAGPHGVGGQIDQVVAFASPTVVLLHWQENPSHPDHEVSVQALEILQGETDARGRPLNVAAITAPLAESDGRGQVSWSYVNVLPVNGAVVVPSFDDPHDEGAHQVLEAAYPGRTVVPVPAHRLYRRGVGIRHVGLPQPTRMA